MIDLRHMLYAMLLSALLISTACADEWGDLKMRFVVAGKTTTPEPVPTDKDEAVCGKTSLMPATPVVSETGELANVVVFLVSDEAMPPSVHESYAKKSDKVEIKMKSCAFSPHIAFVRVGQSLIFKNEDRIGHVAVVQFLKNPAQDTILPGGNRLEIGPETIVRSEKRPSLVVCHIHPWMEAYVLVQDHPYMAASDVNGDVVLKNVPVGKHSFQIWQESVRDLNEKNTTDDKGSPVAWKKGKLEIDVRPGENDLGTFKVKLE